MAEEMKGRKLGGDGIVAEVDGGYFGGYVKPANHAENRRDRRLACNYDYLALLARKSVLGGSPADVATHLLKSSVSEMIEQKIHERQTFDCSDEAP